MSLRETSAGMSLIVRTVCRCLKPFILLYGIHVILYGHLTPGGGFAGGVIAASAFVLILLAEGEGEAAKVLSKPMAAIWDSLGGLVFLGVAILGMWVAGAFFVNLWATPESAHFHLFSGGAIPVSNIAIGLKVCSSLYLVVVVLTAMQRARKPHGEGEKL